MQRAWFRQPPASKELISLRFLTFETHTSTDFSVSARKSIKGGRTVHLRWLLGGGPCISKQRMVGTRWCTSQKRKIQISTLQSNVLAARSELSSPTSPPRDPSCLGPQLRTRTTSESQGSQKILHTCKPVRRLFLHANRLEGKEWNQVKG